MWSDNETAIDSLNVQHVVEAVLQLLALDSLTPVTIGVYGDWGSGKSSVVLMLKSQLEDEQRAPNTMCIVFNGWRFEGYDDAKVALMTTILDELAKRQGLGADTLDLIKKLAKRVNWVRVGKTAAKYALHAGLAVATGGATVIPSVIAEAAASARTAKPDDVIDSAGEYLVPADDAKKVHDTIRDFEKDFAEVLARTDLRRLVVIIDDLDRCSPSQVIETLEAIRLFLAVPKTAFIIAADELLVQNAAKLRFPGLEGRMEGVGREYLEKMVQIPVRVPPLGPRELETYLNMLFLQLHLTKDKFTNACAELLRRAKNDIQFRVTASNAAEVIGEPLTEEMRIDLSLAAQVRRVIALSVDGNPRQVKRFLNAFRLRLIMAKVRNVGLDPRVAAKLMLLEYFRLEAFRTVARWQAAHEGHAVELALIEASRAIPKSQEAVAQRDAIGRVNRSQQATRSASTTGSASPAAGAAIAGANPTPIESGDSGTLPPEAALWVADDWMQAWLDTEPLLGDLDLAPYIHFARERLTGEVTATQRMSPKARETLNLLLSPSRAVRDTAAEGISKLGSTEAVAVLEALAERVRASDTPAEVLEQFPGILTLVSARSELASEFAAMVRSLPVSRVTPGMPNRLLLAASTMSADAQTVIRSVIEGWQHQDKNQSLAVAARLALQGGR